MVTKQLKLYVKRDFFFVLMKEKTTKNFDFPRLTPAANLNM